MWRSTPCSRWVGSVRQMMTSTTRPMGMFTKKIQCQPTLSVSRPPIAGPMSEADAEDGAEEALVTRPAPTVRRLADPRERDREQRAGAEALEAAEEQELPHRLAQPGEGGADEEDADADDEDRAPAEDVGQLPVDWAADGRGQQVRGEGPDVDVVALEVGDDPRQRGAHDRLVEGREEDAEQHRPQGSPGGRGGEARSVRRRGPLGGLSQQSWSCSLCEGRVMRARAPVSRRSGVRDRPADQISSVEPAGDVLRAS